MQDSINKNNLISFEPIGLFKSKQIHPYQAGRQPDTNGLQGYIELKPGKNFEQALQDLAGCSHIWVIFTFHYNENWKPLVQTPRSNKKIGVFATRAPYRPNPIGLSLVKIISIDGLTIKVSENDILDGSPILDIKPYHPEHDIAEEASIQWLEENQVNQNKINYSPIAEEQIDFLIQNGVPEIKTFIQRQLEFDPTNKDKKRVEEKSGYWTLAYRTWRIDFSHADDVIGILNLHSGYTEEDLKQFEDKYADKKLHREFNKIFK
jgi:tRNA (adenine37-N6)-methyltransferase